MGNSLVHIAVGARHCKKQLVDNQVMASVGFVGFRLGLDSIVRELLSIG